ncbi:hypothetical protein NC651_032854 [Populus alba x Populus x berolinensis]|nr:hypothetical protein NC651_032854 [Populus alba x Populus x berolinensis]
MGASVIDADYRGLVKVGNRILQLIFKKILTPDVMEVEDLDAIVRGVGRFGSPDV